MIRSASTADAAQISGVQRDSWLAAYQGIIAHEIIDRVTVPDGGALLDYVHGLAEAAAVQLGGKATVGRGLCRIRVAKGKG